MQPNILILAGPTASGKSAHALEIAENSGGVIINADSQQVYRELRVLTARPSAADEARAPHRLYGFLPASEACSAGVWLQHACMEIDWARAASKTPIVVGGTGLYLRALMQGMAEIPDISPEVRAQAEADFSAMGREAFYQRLCEVEPRANGKLRPSDTQRILRAYSVWLGTGKPLSWWQEKGNKPFYSQDIFTVLPTPCTREEIYARCDARVKAMVNNGAVEEVRELLMLRLPESMPAMRIIGVPELAAHLRGELSLEEAICRMQQATRNYAKRQMTWFRNQLPGAVG